MSDLAFPLCLSISLSSLALVLALMQIRDEIKKLAAQPREQEK
jgi:hypothetical protein